MKLHILSLAFILCVSGFSGCETILDPKDFTTTHKMVIHCFFSPQNPWEIELSASRNLLNDPLEPLWLDQAIILITGNDGTFTDDFKYMGNGKYVNSTLLPEEGVTYSIHIEHDGYQDITATDYIPPSTGMDISINKEQLSGKIWMQMKAVPSTPEKCINLVISNLVRKTYADDDGDSLSFNEHAFLMPALASNDDFYNQVTDTRLSQKLFIKKLKNSAIGILSQGGYRKDTDINLVNAVSTWNFHFGSEAYFNYHWTNQVSKSFPENNGSGFFYKNEYFSNINHGYGIFAGFNLEKYEKPF